MSQKGAAFCANVIKLRHWDMRTFEVGHTKNVCPVFFSMKCTDLSTTKAPSFVRRSKKDIAFLDSYVNL